MEQILNYLMSQTFLQHLGIAVIGALVLYEALTGRMMRWAERGSTKNIAEYCTLMTHSLLLFTPHHETWAYSMQNNGEWRSISRTELRKKLSEYSREAARSLFEINPSHGAIHRDGRIVIIYRYNYIICKPSIEI